MAITTGARFKVVSIDTEINYNDIVTKDEATAYFVNDIQKIIVDGIEYGFNGTDVTPAMLSYLIDEVPSNTIDVSIYVDGGKLKILVEARIAPSVDYSWVSATEAEWDAGAPNELFIGDYSLIATFLAALTVAFPPTVLLITTTYRVPHGGVCWIDGDPYVNTLEWCNTNNGTWAPAYFYAKMSEGVPQILTVEDGGLAVLESAVTSIVTNVFAGIADIGFPVLDAAGLIPTAYFPGSVDEIIEVANYEALPPIGEISKIYVTLDNNLTYRYSGSAYVEISKSLALGETSLTAYRGDLGADAYAHISTTDNPHGVTAAQVGLGLVGNYGFATQTEAEEGTSLIKYMNPARVKDAIDENATMWIVLPA